MRKNLTRENGESIHHSENRQAVVLNTTITYYKNTSINHFAYGRLGYDSGPIGLCRSQKATESRRPPAETRVRAAY